MASSPYEVSKSQQTPLYHNAASHPAADPFVFYDNGQYYAYSTEGADPGFNFAIYSSPDLSTWHKHPGGALDQTQATWARDWLWAPETYYNERTGWYFFFFAGRLREDLTKDNFRYSEFEEPSKLGVAVSRTPTGPFREIQPHPIDYYPFDPDYHDVNLIMDEKQMLPPQSLAKGQTAPRGTYIPTIDPNLFFDPDGRIFLYTSRNAYRNWNWDHKLGKYIEESNIIAIELCREWWDDPHASTMPEIVPSQRDVHARNAPALPANITSFNGTGEIGSPPRKDGWSTVISYAKDPQDWENAHVNDYQIYNGTRKDRRWAEGSTVIVRPDSTSKKPVYLLTYSANNYESVNYGVGFATADSPLGPFHKSRLNPVLSQQPDTKHPIYSTGHGSIVPSPAQHPSGHIGTQEVTHRTPHGAELFYVHHARNSTTNDRSLYTTRLGLNEADMHVGSDTVLDMHLTALDQPLPRWTYPIHMNVRADHEHTQLIVRVATVPGGTFDIRESSNRVVSLPNHRSPSSVEPKDDERPGNYALRFDEPVVELAYQRQLVDGSWTTVTSQRVD